jgi:dihydrofolate reductase
MRRTMRNIINATFITLDGVIADPHTWPSGRVTDPAALAMQTDLLFACDTLLMGRHTYENFAAAWPTRSGDPFSDRLNAMAKLVVSSTLREATWNNTTIISGDPIAEIAKLKHEPGKHIVQYGFGQLSYALMHHGLLDELRLWVSPFFLGRGGPEGLLYRAGQTTTLDLVESKQLLNGDIVLIYRRPS